MMTSQASKHQLFTAGVNVHKVKLRGVAKTRPASKEMRG